MLGGDHGKIGEGEGDSEQRGGRYMRPGKVSEAVVKCAESGPAKENERGSIVCYVLLDSVCFYRSRGREKATQS